MTRTSVSIVVMALCLFLTTRCDNCYFGRHSSLPGYSCRQILAVQPECFGKNGYYWIKDGSGNLTYEYCDMFHKGGGWRRIVYFHSDINTTCPGNWVIWPYVPGHTYCYRDAFRWADLVWNSNGDTTYYEIRGYVNIRGRYYSRPEGFSASRLITPDDGYLEGFEVMAGESPSRYVRSIFAMIVSQRNGPAIQQCPATGGSEYGIFRPNFRDGAYICDELVLQGPLDSRRNYLQVLFANNTCVQCPLGAPWFERRFASPVTDSTIQLRLVNIHTFLFSGNLFLADVEIYIR